MRSYIKMSGIVITGCLSLAPQAYAHALYAQDGIPAFPEQSGENGVEKPGGNSYNPHAPTQPEEGSINSGAHGTGNARPESETNSDAGASDHSGAAGGGADHSTVSGGTP